jgi:retinol dehydrogenase-12
VLNTRCSHRLSQISLAHTSSRFIAIGTLISSLSDHVKAMPFSALFHLSPPPPTFTPDLLIDLSTKVYIITHCSHPTNLSLAHILYALHATIHIGTPNLPAYNTIATQLRTRHPDSKGALKSFIYAVEDLSSTKRAVQGFLEEESRLDVLFLDTATEDVLQSFLLAKLLSPVMRTTASHFCHVNPSIRVVWIANSDTYRLRLNECGDKLYQLAHEFAQRSHHDVDELYAHGLRNRNPEGVQHVVVDHTLPYRGARRVVRCWMSWLQSTRYIAYTLLYAGLGPNVRSGDWIIPWGRKGNVPDDVVMCTKWKESEGKRPSQILYDMCEKNVKPLR